MDFLRKPSVIETCVDILFCAVPIWFAAIIGLVTGWSWLPRWTSLVYLGFRPKLRFIWTAPPGLGLRRLWPTFTGLSAYSVCRTICYSRLRTKRDKSAPAPAVQNPPNEGTATVSSHDDQMTEREQNAVTENDLEHLLHLLEGRDGEMEWQPMMEKTTPNMTYQAWRHEPETGHVVYRSRTVFEEATPEIVRDFFWDDEFRPKWDPMLGYFKTLEEKPHTGTMIVHWIKKFPFFFSDREYIIGRRIWEAGRTYYCVTKGVPYPSLPKRDRPRRVELYFSSWVIKAVESLKLDGQQSACEVTLIHYEDMGIPKDMAKLGVRHGMWGAVKKLNAGLRAYQNARKSEMSLSRSALMARITTKFGMDSLETVSGDVEEERGGLLGSKRHRDQMRIGWKWIVIGGVALACVLRLGAVGKALLAGWGRRLGRRR